MNIEFRELKKEDIYRYKIKNFLFKMIKESYGLDYVPEYHYDIIDLSKYYLISFLTKADIWIIILIIIISNFKRRRTYGICM